MWRSKNTYFTVFLIAILFWVWITNSLEDFFLSSIVYLFFLCISVFPFVYYRQKCFILFFCLTLWYYFWMSLSLSEQKHISQNNVIIDRYIGEYVHYTWRVQELYKRREFYDEYLIEIHSIQDTENLKNILHILRIPKNFHLNIGQVISYSGKVYPLKDFDGFWYKKYMLSRGIYFSTSSNIIDTLEESRQGILYQLSSLRSSFLLRVSTIFPEQEAIFLGGILLGARENIPRDLQEDFNNSWLTHFIAVSGFNITLCILFVTFLFWFLPPTLRIISVASFVLIFSLFVWLWAPVVRAAIMGVIAYIFLQSGRNIRNITLLSFTAVCMVLYSPLSINYDVSLHLSFLAVIGIIYTQDFFKKIFFFVPQTFAIQEALILTLSALSFSLPIMIFQFGQVSLFAPIANIAVTWTIPLAMLAWVITLIFDSISPILWQIFGFPTWILLHYDMRIVRFFWNLESAVFYFDFWLYKNYLQGLYFILLGYFVGLYHLKTKKQP